MLKFLLYWLLVLLRCHFIILTLGLSRWCSMRCLLWLTDKLIDGFKIDGFAQTPDFASLLISLIDVWCLCWLIPGI